MRGPKPSPNRQADQEPVRALTDPRFAPTVVWYRLFTLADLFSRPFLSGVAKPYGINQNDWRVLATLAYLPGSAAHEVCRITGITPMNVSRSVATLRKQGRLREEPDPLNRVRKRLTLTAKGLELYEELLPSIKYLSRKMLEVMTKEEVAILTQLVEKVIARIEKLGGSNWSTGFPGMPDKPPPTARRRRVRVQGLPLAK